MRRACLVATLCLLAVAAGCGGSHVALRRCTLPMSGLGSLRYTGGLLAEMSDGSLVVGVAREHGRTLTVALHRVNASCGRVTSFGTDGVATVSITAKTGPFGYFDTSIDVIAADPNGGLILGGSQGHRELVGRLLENGRLDGSFGHGGWARIDSHERSTRYFSPYASVTSIAFTPSGSVLLGGNDGGAHCCARSLVTEITKTGAVVTSFGSAGTVIVPKMAGSYTTQLAPNSDGSVYVYVEYEQSGGSNVEVVRLRADGSLDRRFDATVARSILRVASANFRFTPTLVPGSGGTFALVGGLDKNTLFGPPEVSTGVEVSVEPSGHIHGKTRFSSSRYEFDNPAAVRLPSGGIVAAAGVYHSEPRPPYDSLRTVLIQSFSPDGSKAGRARIRASMIPPHGHIVGLVPAPKGAWVAMANTQEFELVPVAAG